ncbi:unnamed protein product [Blepharisma stoltei]|uniref:Uncharacterized protein n=1 Tax=Blepharisma stoltei TaxID=1481888 RepID=A0AAU9JVA5_9CILI|nr:unnamed protein product [Blepharisma stoltei]
MEKIENFEDCRFISQAKLTEQYEALKQKILFVNQFLIEDSKDQAEGILESLSSLVSFFQNIDCLYYNSIDILEDTSSDKSWIDLASSLCFTYNFPEADFSCYSIFNKLLLFYNFASKIIF